MLYTNINHIENARDLNEAIEQNAITIIVCGKMNPESISVFRLVEELQHEFQHVHFFDLELDNPLAKTLKPPLPNLNQNEFPVCLIYENGRLMKMLEGIVTKDQISDLINR